MRKPAVPSKMRSDEEFRDRLEMLFLASGFRDLTMGEIAKKMRCSRRRLYQVADAKESLFLLMMGRFFERIRTEGWARANAEPSFELKIGAFLSPGIEGALRLSARAQEDLANFAEGRAVFDDHQEKRISGLERIIQDGIDKGVFRGVHAYLAAELMLLIVRRVRDPGFQARAGMTFSEALAEISLLIRHGLLHAEPAKDGSSTSDTPHASEASLFRLHRKQT